MTTDSADSVRPVTGPPDEGEAADETGGTRGTDGEPAHAGESSAGEVDDASSTPPQRSPWPARVLLVAIGVVMWGVDQLVKSLVLAHLVAGEPVSVVGSLLRFTLVRNPGAAFSLGVRYTIVFSVIAILAALFVIVVLLPRTRHLGWAVALGLLLAGILGNLTDRLFRPPGPLRGHVIDFIQLPHFAIFNVADMCVTTAAVMIIVLAVLINVSLNGERGRDRQPTGR